MSCSDVKCYYVKCNKDGKFRISKNTIKDRSKTGWYEFYKIKVKLCDIVKSYYIRSKYNNSGTRIKLLLWCHFYDFGDNYRIKFSKEAACENIKFSRTLVCK